MQLINDQKPSANAEGFLYVQQIYLILTGSKTPISKF